MDSSKMDLDDDFTDKKEHTSAMDLDYNDEHYDYSISCYGYERLPAILSRGKIDIDSEAGVVAMDYLKSYLAMRMDSNPMDVCRVLSNLDIHIAEGTHPLKLNRSNIQKKAAIEDQNYETVELKAQVYALYKRINWHSYFTGVGRGERPIVRKPFVLQEEKHEEKKRLRATQAIPLVEPARVIYRHGRLIWKEDNMEPKYRDYRSSPLSVCTRVVKPGRIRSRAPVRDRINIYKVTDPFTRYRNRRGASRPRPEERLTPASAVKLDPVFEIKRRLDLRNKKFAQYLMRGKRQKFGWKPILRENPFVQPGYAPYQAQEAPKKLLKRTKRKADKNAGGGPPRKKRQLNSGWCLDIFADEPAVPTPSSLLWRTSSERSSQPTLAVIGANQSFSSDFMQITKDATIGEEHEFAQYHKHPPLPTALVPTPAVATFRPRFTHAFHGFAENTRYPTVASQFAERKQAEKTINANQSFSGLSPETRIVSSPRPPSYPVFGLTRPSINSNQSFSGLSPSTLIFPYRPRFQASPNDAGENFSQGLVPDGRRRDADGDVDMDSEWEEF